MKDGTAQIAYDYDAVGNVTTVTDSKGNETSYTWDKSSRMKTVSFDGNTLTYEYDANGNRESIAYDGGVREDYSYDKNNRLLTLINSRPDGSEISRYSYTYDLAGRQTTKTDSYGTSGYTYDAVGRILKAETPGKTSIYGYDRAGNRTSMNETYASEQSTGFTDEISGSEVSYILKKSQYVYTASNRLVKLVEEMYDNGNTKVLTKTIQYTYDANGNQLSEYASFTHPNHSDYRRTISASSYGDGQQTAPDSLIDRTLNTYDGFDRLTKVEKVEAGVRTVAEYVYNGDDLRTKKTVRKSDNAYAAEVTYFLYDRQHVILETDGSGNTAARYIRGINYVAQYSKATSNGGSASLAYYLYNGHGDVVQTVSASGEVQNRYDYDIFGNPTLSIEVSACNLRYAGEYLDNETGLYYLRARYYDPSIGRFISEDSYWGDDTNPLSLNLYTYCFNDPIRFIDPTGHSAYEDILSNARKQAQTNSIINEINKQKDIWFAEERGTGKNQKEWTNAQTEANRRAEALRQQLIQLESGNADIQRLIKDDSKAIAGAWEGYQMSVTARLADANPSVDYSSTIKRQTQDYALAVISGLNAVGIHASDIVKSNKSKDEILAEMLADSLQASYAPLNANSGTASVNVQPGNMSLGSTNKATDSSNQVNLSINGVSISGSKIIDGKTYVDVTRIALALGCSEFKYNSENVSIKYVDEAGAVYKYSLSTSLLEKDSYGRHNLIGVRDLASKLGLEDTLSWWNDNGKLNVTIREDMNYSPVKVTRDGNEINIAANINFTGDAKELFPGTNKTYADVIAGGIQGKWDNLSFTGTNYDFGVGNDITVKTTINRAYNTAQKGFNKYFELNVDNDEAGVLGITKISILGIDVDRQVSHMTGGLDNWSVSNPGMITMYKDYNGGPDYSEDEYGRTVAHEFGHILGIGDAYGYKPGATAKEKAKYDNRSEAQDTTEVPGESGGYGGWDMMRGNDIVTANDVEMVWEAWKTNKWQYFVDYNGHKKSSAITSY
jgi:RHS repeat-associated protein